MNSTHHANTCVHLLVEGQDSPGVPRTYVSIIRPTKGYQQSSNPVASGRGVHEKISRLHPQDDDDLADVLPDPFSLPRIKLRASEVDIMEVVAKCHESLVLTSTVGGLRLFARWVPLALSPI
jgi:hypothetical protein